MARDTTQGTPASRSALASAPTDIKQACGVDPSLPTFTPFPSFLHLLPPCKDASDPISGQATFSPPLWLRMIDGTRRATAIWPGSRAPSSVVRTTYPFFLHSIYVGLVPLFSNFFYAILSHYQIQALHHQPNFVLLLAIFVFYYEAFVGMRPSVPLFDHFFSLWLTAQGQRSACVSFVDVTGAGIHLRAGKMVEGYRNHSVFMDARWESLFLATPSGLSEQTPKWNHKKLANPRVGPILERIASLMEARLMGAMIIKEFLGIASRSSRRTRAPCGSSPPVETQCACMSGA
ncbi:hypothetical protein D1007_14130 [Hordeum vulgare]|nr:hypothetical protein D1007_14130 [Hordeum vulgare]